MVNSARAEEWVVATALTLAIDQVTGEVVRAFGEEGIRSVLLKGPSIARWLYPEGGRFYGDTDLLVQPADFEHATQILGRIGFGEPAHALVDHAHTYRRVDVGGTPLHLDLHRTLPYFTARPSEVWDVLTSGTGTQRIAGVDTETLGIPALSLHIALHALQHVFESPSPSEDLRRAVALVSDAQWSESAGISRALGAEDALAAGLCLLPEGQLLADRLGLTSHRRGILRMSASSDPGGPAYQVQRAFDASTLGERVRLIVNPLFVSPSVLRKTSALARRGRLGLTLAYAARPFLLARRIGPALAERRRILKPR